MTRGHDILARIWQEKGMLDGLTLRADLTIEVNCPRSFGNLYLICKVALAARCIRSVGLSSLVSALIPAFRSRLVTKSGHSVQPPTDAPAPRNGTSLP